MKIIWAILLGMLIFQSLFVTLGVFFPSSPLDEGFDEISSNTTGYENITLSKPGSLFDFMSANSGWFVGLGTTILVVAMIALKNYAGAAIALFLGFMTWLFTETSKILMAMNIGSPEQRVFGTALIGLFGVVLAILAVKEIISMLAPGGTD